MQAAIYLPLAGIVFFCNRSHVKRFCSDHITFNWERKKKKMKARKRYQGQDKHFTKSTTLLSVWFAGENCSGIQLVRSSARLQLESEGKEVLKSSFSLWRSAMLGKQSKTCDGILWSSWALLAKSGKLCRESRYIIFGYLNREKGRTRYWRAQMSMIHFLFHIVFCSLIKR